MSPALRRIAKNPGFTYRNSIRPRHHERWPRAVAYPFGTGNWLSYQPKRIKHFRRDYSWGSVRRRWAANRRCPTPPGRRPEKRVPRYRKPNPVLAWFTGRARCEQPRCHWVERAGAEEFWAKLSCELREQERAFRWRDTIDFARTVGGSNRRRLSYADKRARAPALLIVLPTDASSASVPSYTSFRPLGRASVHTRRVNSKRRAESFSYRLF